MFQRGHKIFAEKQKICNEHKSIEKFNSLIFPIPTEI